MGTSSPVSAPEREFDADVIKDWVVARAKPLSIGAGAVVVAVAGVLFWQQSTRLKEDRAETAYGQAATAFYAGNTPLAKTDLEKVVTRYSGTTGAAQAAVLLAQISYGEGKYDAGVKQLTDVQGSVPGVMAAQVEEMIAAGLADAKKYDDAAKHYLKAADLSRFPADKDLYKAEAARVLGFGGKAADARKIWAELASNRESPVINEARVRVGESDAKAASK